MHGRTLRRERRLQPSRLGKLARAPLLVALGLLTLLALPSAATAQRGLVTGLMGFEQYQTTDPDPSRGLWFDRTVDAGAGIVRLAVSWRRRAPERPAEPTNPASYDFSFTDGAVRDAAARGLQVLINVNNAPDWAEGPDRPASAPTGTWKPNPSDFGDFVQAVAARYSGRFDPDGPGPQPPVPAADAVEVWTEPNQEAWLGPQFRGKEIVGPAQYRELLNAAYNAVKSVNPRMLVVTGGTSPYGDEPGGPYPAGAGRVRPVEWWEKLLCVQAAKRKKERKPKQVRYARGAGCGGKPLFDVFAHQPIDITCGGPQQSGPHRDDVSTPDLGRLVSVLRAAERLGTISGGPHPVWVTEFWWDSNPPNPVGVPFDIQAAWIQQSLYLFWKAGASVAINFQIRDSTQHLATNSGFQSGLFLLDGSPKPALTAFRFPFVIERINARTLRAWGKAPEAGKLLIQRAQGKRWKTIKTLQVGKGAVFLTDLDLRSSALKGRKGKKRRKPVPGTALRATVRASESLVWQQR